MGGAAASFASALLLLLAIPSFDSSGAAAAASASAATATAPATTENQRLVADVWTAVSSAYYDPTFNGLGTSGWRQKETEAMAAVSDAGPDDDDLVADAIGGMLSSLGDPYTRFLPREKYEALTSYATGGKNNFGVKDDGGGIGVQLLEDLRTGRMMVMATTAGGPAASAGMRPGDAIVRIDGADVAGYSAEIVAAKCRGATGGKVELDFVRRDDADYDNDDATTATARGGTGTTLRHLSLTRARIDSSNPIVASTFVSAGGRNVGLLKVPSFSTETASQIVDGLRSVATGGGGTGGGSVVVDAIAIDIRGNVGGYMPGGVDSAKLFLPAGLRVISEVGRPGGTTPSSTKNYDADGIGAETSLPLYLLVDGRTASASEIFAAALQDNGRAIVVGTTNTFGKGRIQNVRPLGNGCGVAITRARYVTPRGRDLHGVGIVPDRVPDRCGINDSARTCLAGIV